MENNKKLTRASAGNRMVAGVCAGIADYCKVVMTVRVSAPTETVRAVGRVEKFQMMSQKNQSPEPFVPLWQPKEFLRPAKERMKSYS